MNKLLLLKSKLSSTKTTKQINWIAVDVPFNLKDECRIKFKGQIKWDADVSSWVADEEIADNFSKVFLEEYTKPTKEEILVLKNSGANFDKTTKLWFLLKYQTEEVIPTDEPTDGNV